MKARFSVATSDGWTDADGQRQEKTNWHTAVAFNNMAKIVQVTIQKGSQVMVEGPMEYRDFTKSDGAKGRAAELSSSPCASPTAGKSRNAYNQQSLS
jgi:single-strand DNA-binding protein